MMGVVWSLKQKREGRKSYLLHGCEQLFGNCSSSGSMRLEANNRWVLLGFLS